MRIKFEQILSNLEIGNSLVIADQKFSNEVVIDYQIQCSVLSEIHFLNCDFQSVDFTGSCFGNCIFENCRFQNTVFSKSEFWDCVFQDCQILNVDLKFWNSKEWIEIKDFSSLEKICKDINSPLNLPIFMVK